MAAKVDQLDGAANPDGECLDELRAASDECVDGAVMVAIRMDVE
jgi:hypothetical protein